MAKPEDDLRREYIEALKPNQRRFFIDAGNAWKSDAKNTHFVKKVQTVTVYPGDMVLRHPQVFHGGPPGWFDAAGWDMVTILPSDVPAEGLTVAIFAGDELKTKNDRLRPLQRLLGQLLAKMGGRWRVVR